jgi:hypothetical protein
VPADQIPQLLDKLRHELVSIVTRWRQALPDVVYKYLMHSSVAKVQVPHFYLLPKVHKMQEVTTEYLHQLTGRPIAANHSCFTTAASTYLADVLNEACYSKYDQVLPNSRCPEQGVKLLGLLLTGSTGQRMAGRNGLA